ncbi:MAG: hypothetical protein ABFD04_14490 [Syntrophomonas sp.]
MPKLKRLLVVIILLSAATTGMVMGARWTGSESEKPAAQYMEVQTGVEEKPEGDSANSHNWAVYSGVLALTGLYITGRIIGVKKRSKTKQA